MIDIINATSWYTYIRPVAYSTDLDNDVILLFIRNCFHWTFSISSENTEVFEYISIIFGLNLYSDYLLHLRSIWLQILFRQKISKHVVV